MDFTAVIGILFGALMIGLNIYQNGVLGNFWDWPSLALVLGGTIGALMVTFPFSVLAAIPKYLKKIIKPPKFDPRVYVKEISDIAFTARKTGLLSLEEYISKYPDAFLRKGVRLIVDSIEPDLVRSILESELSYMSDRHKKGQLFFERAGAYSPGFGMLGTLVGLINMLSESFNPESLVGNMSMALITTFYGCLLSNLVFLPIAGKLKALSNDETLCKQIIVEGVVAIQAGENPRQIQEKLLSLLPLNMRDLDKVKSRYERE